MKKIAVITTSTAFPGEKGLNRMFYIANLLSNNGFDIELITSDFQHWDKKHRKIDSNLFIDNIKVKLIHEIGYKRNIDPKRIISHFLLANKIYNYIKPKQFDLVYCDIPDNHVAFLASKYAKHNNIPFIVDIEDLWPEAMKMVFNIPIISSLLFSYFSRDAKRTYRNASGFIGSSDTYKNEPNKYGVVCDLSETIYVGNEMSIFDEGVSQYSKEIEKNNNEYWVTYAGSLGSSYGIKTMIDSACLLSKYKEIKFYILGDGPLRIDFEKYANEKECNVVFLGYVDYKKMAAYLKKSNVSVNSLVKGAAQSIVSKIGDYLAAGIPLINTGEDKEFRKKVENDDFGINVNPDNPQELSDAILLLKNNPQISKRMGKNARKIAEIEFDRKNSFKRIILMIESLLGEK